MGLLLQRKFRATRPVSSADASSRYFLQQNAGIANGTVSGVPINLKVLGVGDGLTVSKVIREVEHDLIDIGYRTLCPNTQAISVMRHPTRK